MTTLQDILGFPKHWEIYEVHQNGNNLMLEVYDGSIKQPLSRPIGAFQT